MKNRTPKEIITIVVCVIGILITLPLAIVKGIDLKNIAQLNKEIKSQIMVDYGMSKNEADDILSRIIYCVETGTSHVKLKDGTVLEINSGYIYEPATVTMTKDGSKIEYTLSDQKHEHSDIVVDCYEAIIEYEKK